MTAALPLFSPCPTQVPTPLEADVSRVRTGMSLATMAAVLTGLACVGYMAYLGYVMIRK